MTLDADAQLETITEKITQEYLGYDNFVDESKYTFQHENKMLGNEQKNNNSMSSNKEKNKTLYYYKTKKGCFFPIGYLKSNGNSKYIFTKSDKNPQNEFSKLTLSFENNDDFIKHIFTDDEMKLELPKSELKKIGGKKTLRKRKNKKKPRRKRNTRKTYQ